MTDLSQNSSNNCIKYKLINISIKRQKLLNWIKKARFKLDAFIRNQL